MGKAKPVTIGSRNFDKQGDALAHFRNMLYRYEIDQVVDGDDDADLRALIGRHQEREKKIGCGISRFEVMLSPEQSRCFGIVHPDGSRIDFSFVKCITGRWE